MKLSKVIAELESIRKEYGDVEVALQDAPEPGTPVTAFDSFFVVPEHYPDDGWRVNIRTWPY